MYSDSVSNKIRERDIEVQHFVIKYYVYTFEQILILYSNYNISCILSNLYLYFRDNYWYTYDAKQNIANILFL